MKKSMFCIFAVLLMLLSACGGGSSKDDSNLTTPTTLPISTMLPETEGTIESTLAERTDPTIVTQEAVPSRSIKCVDPFHEDRAWIEYTEGENRYYGIIDLQGNVLSRIDYHDNMIYQPFSNGFTHTYNYATHISMIIDKDGNVTYQRDESYQTDAPEVIFRGAGILVTVENVSDFYGTGYQYTIIDHEGNVLEQFTLERELYGITNCGKGVIRFPQKGYLCLQTHTWVSDDITSEGSWDTPSFVDAPGSTCVIGVENSEVPQLVFLSADGSTWKVPLGLSYYDDDLHISQFHPLSDDFLCITCNDKLVATVNIETGEIYRLDASYRDILERIEFISDDRIIVLLNGADNHLYNFIFDQNLNLICGPVEDSMVSTFSESIIIGRDSSNNRVVCDKDCNTLFSLSELGYTDYQKSRLEQIPFEYSSGVLLACDKDSNPVYLDKEGKLLFDTFNFANTKHIETTD